MNKHLSYPALFAETVWPWTGVGRDIALVVGGSWLVALLAQVQVPLWPVPVTGQTFGVLLVGSLLGSRRGALSMLTYLAQGFLGLPVFAGGAAGVARLFGPTGGYLIGFVVAAFIVGRLSELGWERRFWSAVAALLIGNLCIYAVGLPWLAAFVGWAAVLQAGFFPFLVGDVLKVVLAALALPWGWALLSARRML
jgi:biotin transport system substrate-specific component